MTADPQPQPQPGHFRGIFNQLAEPGQPRGGPLRLTTARWLNRKTVIKNTHDGESAERWSKVLAHRGTYEQFAYGTDTPSEWNRRDLQICIICSPLTGVIVVDVDDETEFLTTRTSGHIGRAQAMSTRGPGFHVLVDARGVPAANWPRQGPIAGADIKSCGFVPVPGSWHWSGERYELMRKPNGRTTVVAATPELIEAMNADLAERKGGGVSGTAPGGTGGGHDGEIAARVLGWVRQAVNAGNNPAGPVKEAIYAEWLKIAIPRDPGWPFERDDFERHLRTALAKAAATPAPEMPADVFEWAESKMNSEPAADTPDQGNGVVAGTVVGPPQVVLPKTGLDALMAARWVMSQGPLLHGIDSRLWAYQRGVWVPGEDDLAGDLVHKRMAYLFGKHYRQAHESNTREMILAQVDRLRCDPVREIINFPNGLLAWANPAGPALAPHDPAVLSTVQLAANWNSAATCPAFDAFLAGVLAPEDVPRMWEVIGYLLMSGNPLHKIMLLYGRGFNGKGVLLRVITALLGEASVSSVSLHSLAEERFTRVGLLGKLANICGDIDATYIERTGLLKQLTGEDMITAEHKFRKPAQFTNWAVPVFSANEIPTSSDTSLGWRERWEVFRFPNVFAHDPALEAPLRQPAELEGIAARGVAALRTLMARTPPAFIRTAAGDAAKADFTAHQDPLHGWLAEDCWANPQAWTDQRYAYARYKQWATDAGTKYPMGKPKFYALMRERFAETRRNGYPGFSGLELKTGGSEFSQ